MDSKEYKVYVPTGSLDIDVVGRYHDGDNIIIPIIDGEVLYVYVKNGVDTSITDVLVDTGMTVGYEELRKFVKNVDKRNEFKVGEYVWIKQYGKMPFFVEHINEDDVTVEFEFRGFRYRKKINKTDIISKVNDGFFVMNKSNSTPNIKYTILVDSDYFGSIFGDSHYNIVSGLIRIKFMFPNSVYYFTKTNNSKLLDIIKLFGFKIGGWDKYDAYFTDKIINGYGAYKIKSDNDSIVTYEINNCSVLFDYLKVDNLSNVKRYIYGGGCPDALKNKARAVKFDINTSDKTIGVYTPEVDTKRIKEVMNKAKWVWFIENFDYYLGIILYGV